MFCFECVLIVHGGRGCLIPQRSRLSAAEDMKQWGVSLRANNGRRRGSGGESVFFNEEEPKPSQLADMGADGDDYRVGSMSMGSSRFSGNLRHVPNLLHRLVCGNSISFHTKNVGGRVRKIGQT
jgi:hypothetical protein